MRLIFSGAAAARPPLLLVAAPADRAAHPLARRRDPRYPCPARRFPVFPLREPGRAQGRRGRVRHVRQLRRLQPVHPRRQSGDRPPRRLAARRWRHSGGQRGRARLGEPAGPLRRRDRNRLWAPRRDGRDSARPDVGRVRAAPRGTVRGRHARHGRGRGLDLQHAAGEGGTQLPRDVRGRRGRRGAGAAAGRVPLPLEREPRAAAPRG